MHFHLLPIVVLSLQANNHDTSIVFIFRACASHLECDRSHEGAAMSKVARPRIEEFPLIWRWRQATHAIFARSDLATLQPCTPIEAQAIRAQTRTYIVRNGWTINCSEQTSISVRDVSQSKGCAWLRSLVPDLLEEIIVSWDDCMALWTKWELFTRCWDDFCYPFDDVIIIPKQDNWLLWHSPNEVLHFGRCARSDVLNIQHD